MADVAPAPLPAPTAACEHLLMVERVVAAFRSPAWVDPLAAFVDSKW